MKENSKQHPGELTPIGKEGKIKTGPGTGFTQKNSTFLIVCKNKISVMLIKNLKRRLVYFFSDSMTSFLVKVYLFAEKNLMKIKKSVKSE